MKAVIKYTERNGHQGQTTYTSPYTITKQDMVVFFGLDQKDILQYSVELFDETEEKSEFNF